jgi:hypothetical protein
VLAFTLNGESEIEIEYVNGSTRLSGVVWVFGSVAVIVPMIVPEAMFSFTVLVKEDATNEGALLISNTVIVTVAVEERLTPAPLLATWTRRV